MKQIFTLILMGFFTEILIAQPVITSDYNPIFGDTYIYKIVDDTSTAQPGQAGAGVVWNLASMHGLLTTRQYNWIQTALTSDAVTFGANSNIAAEVVQTNLTTRYEYYDVGANFTGDMKRVGGHIDLAVTNFYGGYLQFDYPLSFNQSCSDTIVGSNVVANIYGNVNTTYDGYGTLQLEAQSGGNFSNVGRIKVEENYVMDFGVIETHHVETYYWMDNTTVNMTKQPIAIISIHEWYDTFGDFKREKFALMRQVIFINGMPVLSSNVSDVTVSPNPFSNKIVFSIPAFDSDIDIMISDITGQSVKEIHLPKSVVNREESVAMDELRSGVYIAKISSENSTVVKKIIKD
jgi:hypothetical protein